MLCKNIFAFTVGIFLPIASLFAEIADGYAKRFLIAPGQKLGLTAYSSLEDFPVLVRLSTSIVGFDYADFKKSDVVAGEKVPSDLDILFVDENGTELSYEIQVWNPEGVSLVWVKVPTLTVNSQITCYFGNAEELKSNNPNDTWVAYAGVWHLDDIGEGGTSPDSTANGYTAICTSSTKSTTGIPSTDDDPLGAGGYRENVGKRTVEEGDLPNGTGSGVIFEGTQNLKPSDQTHFTVSGWFRRNHINNGWDHLFYKKNESKGGNGWGMEMNKEKTYPANLDVFGIWEAYNGATLNHGIAIADKWYYLSIVFDGQTRKLYNNGSLLSSGKSKDWALPNWNDLKIALGNDSDQNGSVFQGSFDEPRLRLVSYDDVWAKAEYESMASADSLVYSDVVAATAAIPIIENVLLNRDINGVFTLSVSLSDDSSAGDVSIIINEKNTIEIAKNVSAGENVEYALENLGSDMGYSVRVVLTDAIGQSDTKRASAFITGEVSVEGNGFAKEEGVIESGFTFSRPVSASAYELEVAYSIAGTAEGGSSYEALSGIIVFPAGVSEVVVPVKPIINSSVDDDVVVVVTVLPGLYIASENSASVIIDNYRVIDGSSSLIAISEPDVIYSGNEVAISLAIRNGAGTLSVTLEDENGNTYEREIATSTSGIGIVVKKASELDLPTGHWYTLKKAFANGVDASYDDRYTDIKFFMGTVCVHRILDAYEYGLAKGRFRIAIEGECMTSSDIALKYEIGGSASAGREYVALSGAATISAGTAYVDIYVTPMDNGFEGNTKLTVSLASDANTSLVSLNPAVAEIAIVDNSANIDINHFHKKLWLEASEISNNEVLSNFPALIRIREGLRGFSYSDLEDCASGSDLAFADAEGNIIPHEIECWNPEGESTIWVKIPLLRNGTRIRMCYGGPALVSKVSSIWSAYKSVWHLNEPEGSKEFANAQGDRMIGVNHNTIYSDGVVGPARRISEGQRGVADSHYIAVKDFNTSGVQGIINSDNAHKNFSMWLRYPVGQTPSKDILVQQQYQEGDAFGWTIRLAENISGLYTACNYEGKNSAGVFDDLADGEWHHLVVVFDSDKRYIYVDGELRTRMTDVKAIAGDWSWQPMAWGGYMNGNNKVSFKGWMDEIRFGAGIYPAPETVDDDSVEGGVRYVAPALVKAEYKNVKDGIFRIVRDGIMVIVR